MTPRQYVEVTDQTAIYPEKGLGTLYAVTYCALGLGEAGEVQGKVKKVWRGDKPLEEAKEEILDELGDVLWYVTRMAIECDSTLEALMMRNARKLLDRKNRGTLQGSGDHR
jgi:NTP pyrophosphatase (non-canonical NTP hydrolase)